MLLAVLLPQILTAQQNASHIAYIYPAGGRQGTTFQATVGGQFLGAVSNAFLSTPDVKAEVIEYNRPMPQKEFSDLRDQLKALMDKRKAASGFNPGTNTWTAADARSYMEIRDKILKNPPNRQASPALSETVTLKITIATNAEPGEREIRLKTPNALSNPLVFCVGELPEFSKPLSRAANPELDKMIERLGGKPTPAGTPKYEAHIHLPATVNGQIMPGGADRYLFTAHKGQQLVITAGARELIPFLADAVPGWFEATLTIYDAARNETAFDERFHFKPDPVIHFEAPHDGDYVIEIHDSIFRGREDFVYRLTLGELPYITGIFPLGGPAGGKTDVELTGWNLPTHSLNVDNSGRTPGIYSICVTNDGHLSNPVPFGVDDLPEQFERTPDNPQKAAEAVALPVIINGRIGQPGEEDVFSFEGKAGERIVAEVIARRLDSPLDSVLALLDGTGKQLAFNDDFEDKGSGLETHHADSYIAATLPADGTYRVRIGDAQHHGGPDFAYRLRISAPEPDFALRVAPSGQNIRAGLSAPVTVFALRKDGFTNAIELRLRGAPPGFTLSGARVPENQDKAQFTMKAPPRQEPEPVSLTLEGRAIVAGKEIIHAAVPAEDMMQAFAYRHLVPVKDFEVAVAGNPRPFAANAIRILSATPVKIPSGGTALVRFSTPSEAFESRFDLELNGAPDGITIQKVSSAGSGLEILFGCDAARAKAGLKGNLVLNLMPKAQTAQSAQKPGIQRRNSPGALPAIPFEISAE
jgi:hypothetical protein